MFAGLKLFWISEMPQLGTCVMWLILGLLQSSFASSVIQTNCGRENGADHVVIKCTIKYDDSLASDEDCKVSNYSWSHNGVTICSHGVVNDTCGLNSTTQLIHLNIREMTNETEGNYTVTVLTTCGISYSTTEMPQGTLAPFIPMDPGNPGASNADKGPTVPRQNYILPLVAGMVFSGGLVYYLVRRRRRQKQAPDRSAVPSMDVPLTQINCD